MTKRVVEAKLKWFILKWSDLDSTPGVETTSPVMPCCGHNWRISLYPGGKGTSVIEEGRAEAEKSIAIYLHYEGSRSIGAFGLKGKDRDDAVRQFKKLDTNGNGLLDLTELLKGAGILSLSEDLAKKWFYEIDKDGSGEISALEFVDMFERLTTAKVHTKFGIRIINQLATDSTENEDGADTDIQQSTDPHYKWTAPGRIIFTAGPESHDEKLTRSYGTSSWMRRDELENDANGWKVNDCVMIEIDIMVLKDSEVDLIGTISNGELAGAQQALDAEDGSAACEARKLEKTSERIIAMRAVKRHWTALKFVSDELKKDKELVWAAILQNWGALELASDELKGDRDFMIKSVKLNWRTLKFASVDFDNDLSVDPEIVFAAVCQDGCALQFASKRLKSDRHIVLKAVETNGRALQFVADELKKDREIVRLAIQNYSHAIQYASPELKFDRDFNRQTIQLNGYSLQDESVPVINEGGNALQFASAMLKDDRDRVLDAVRVHWSALEYVSQTLKNDRDIVIEAVKQNGNALVYASSNLKNDRDLVLEAVRQNGCALQFASAKLKNDRVVVLEAVNQFGYALQFASTTLKLDQDFMTEVVKLNVRAMQVVPANLKNDRSFMAKSVQTNERAFQYASGFLKDDKEFLRETGSLASSRGAATWTYQ